MAKAKTAYVCGQCGAEHTKWQGQCEACGVWNTLTEFVIAPATAGAAGTGRRSGYSGASAQPRIVPLTEVAAAQDVRTLIGIGELDRVLGGGLVDGSVVLVGGDPGIGKSTLLLQTLGALGARMRSLYVSGEESLAQIASRAQRLGLPLEPLRCLAETCVERILESVQKEFSGAQDVRKEFSGAGNIRKEFSGAGNIRKEFSGAENSSAQKDVPRVLVIDSIQTIWTDLLTAAPGSVSQVRESAARLVRFAKETGTSIFLVGHVTKEGGIAGPRVLEHMVDAVLYFEGESGSRFRVLRAFKNRFGAVNELSVFAMGDKGLREVPNPSAIFLSAHGAPTPGSAVMVTREGTRPLLVEVQALVDQSSLGNPRRVTLGLEQNRLAMLLAVLHRHGGIAVYDQDVFVNVVGGIRVQETAADLPVLLAVLSSFRDRPLPDKLVAFGEVGLSGEIRPVPNGEERLREAATHGFLKAIIPRANAPKKLKMGEMEIVPVERLRDALDASS
jgi:DNA repair protein RadA/Sms